MAEFIITCSPDGATVVLSARGHFDLPLGFAFWQYCQPEMCRRETFVFNLAGVTELRDSGLGWLMMFLRWARRSGMGVRVINASPEVGPRLSAAGIEVQDALAAERTRRAQVIGERLCSPV